MGNEIVVEKKCLECNGPTIITKSETRDRKDSIETRRTRLCSNCGYKFDTIQVERAESVRCS